MIATPIRNQIKNFRFVSVAEAIGSGITFQYVND